MPARARTTGTHAHQFVLLLLQRRTYISYYAASLKDLQIRLFFPSLGSRTLAILFVSPPVARFSFVFVVLILPLEEGRLLKTRNEMKLKIGDFALPLPFLSLSVCMYIDDDARVKRTEIVKSIVSPLISRASSAELTDGNL